MSDFDFDDPLIRDMVDRNHTPVEAWDVAGKLLFCHCQECQHEWPCPTRQALRERWDDV